MSQCRRLRISEPMCATVVDPAESSCPCQFVEEQNCAAVGAPNGQIGQLPKKCLSRAPHSTAW